MLKFNGIKEVKEKYPNKIGLYDNKKAKKILIKICKKLNNDETGLVEKLRQEIFAPGQPGRNKLPKLWELYSNLKDFAYELPAEPELYHPWDWTKSNDCVYYLLDEILGILQKSKKNIENRLYYHNLLDLVNENIKLIYNNLNLFLQPDEINPKQV